MDRFLTNSSGLIELARPELAAEVASRMLGAASDANVLVIGQRDRRQAFKRELRQLLRVSTTPSTEALERVRVVSANEAYDRVHGETDFVLLLDANQLLNREEKNQKIQAVLRAPEQRFRLFGLLPTPNSERKTDWITSKTRQRLRHWLGPHAMIMVGPRHYVRDVRTLLLKTRDHVRRVHCRYGDSLLLKRATLWENRELFDLIADRVGQIERGEWSQFRVSADQVDDIANAAAPRTAVLVENDRQRDGLLEHLPEWTTYRCDSTMHYVRSRNVVTHRELATAVLDQIDVLVRADATIGVPLSLDEAVRTSQASSPLLLVDFRTDFQPQLKQWFDVRVRAYRERDWHSLRDSNSGGPGDL